MDNILNVKDNVITTFDENMLVKKAINGDKESFIYILKKYKVDLYKIAYMYVKDEEKALEILQETIVKGVFNIRLCFK